MSAKGRILVFTIMVREVLESTSLPVNWLFSVPSRGKTARCETHHLPTLRISEALALSPIYIFTTWCSGKLTPQNIIFEKLTVAQTVKKFPPFMELQVHYSVYRTRHWESHESSPHPDTVIH
jgi:hypothetical protein